MGISMSCIPMKHDQVKQYMNIELPTDDQHFGSNKWFYAINDLDFFIVHVCVPIVCADMISAAY